MAGITAGVYDIFQPTPVSLIQLSAIAVSLEVWRCKINEYRRNRKLKEFRPRRENADIMMKTLLPDLPPMIYSTIDKYVKRFRHWLGNYTNYVFERFEDFVCDYNGVIDYVRTAERMMHCDRFDVNLKFAIACKYFFEDDIRRIWPSVPGNVNLNNTDFTKSPQLYYWICYLTNKLDKIPSTEINVSIEEVMLNAFIPHNRPSVEYFWNRLPAESRMRKAVDIFKRDAVSFVRFVLPKLDNQELKAFLNNRTYKLVRHLSRKGKAPYDEELILSTWGYVKNAINLDEFVDLVLKMLRSEIIECNVEDEFDNDDHRSNPWNWSRLCCEIWDDAEENWKRSVVAYITQITHNTSNNRLSADLWKRSMHIPAPPIEFKFLSSVLSYANNEERRRFWFNYWNDIFGHVQHKNLPKIMKLCFENEDEITQFKENVMPYSNSFPNFCRALLRVPLFDNLNDWASFLFSEVQAARNFKQQLLQENLLNRDDTRIFDLIKNDWKTFNQFIDDAYDNADHSANFKHQLMSSPEKQACLARNALKLPLEQLVGFIDTFASAEDTLQQIKTRIISALKEKAAADKSVLSQSSFTELLLWCV